MASTGDLTPPTATTAFRKPVSTGIDATNMIRIGVVILIAVVWEALSRSGLLFRDVVPSLLAIGTSMWKLLLNPAFYTNLQVTAWEIFTSLAIGSALGIFVGIVIGANRFLSLAYEPYVYYLAPTPRIIFPTTRLTSGRSPLNIAPI